ncbi:MAG TPA: SpoIIE family protein phosphatase [Streptosporangiaceae bacterium]|nr:SpoIIE family protein phosphatase [Streptosporangiaceae bacterium]
MTDISAPDAVAALTSRTAALRRAAGNPKARQEALLDAALTELDAAIEALAAAGTATVGAGRDEQASGGQHSDRRLLQAAFAQAPIALLVIDGDATVRRANLAACELLGVGPGYATGKALTAMIESAGQATLRTQVAAVVRTGKPAAVSCGLLSSAGPVGCQLAIRPLSVRGDDDRLLVAVRPDSAGDGLPAVTRATSGKRRAERADRAPGDEEVSQLTRRADLLAAAARLLLEDGAASESVILQRCARLLAAELATWVIVDVHHRGMLRRHFVAGPDDPTSARLAQVVAASAPEPGTVSFRVCESGSSDLITHAEDEQLLGTDSDGTPLLVLLSAASVLAVPVFDGARGHGVLTLVRDAAAGAFQLGDVGLAERIGELLAKAMSARRMLTRQTEAAQALRSSLLPPVLKTIPGVDIAAAHMAPTRGREVGGDFYDVYPTPDGWGVAIGDVCGKGDDAAAATAAARHAIRVLAHWNPDPAQVLRGANDIMLTEEFGSRFVTADAAHLRWDGRTLRVRLGSAGHPGPVLLKPDGRASLLAGGGVALGIFQDPEPAVSDLELESGDVLFFFTDGLTGARSAQQGYFEAVLADTLAPLAGRHAADIVAEMRKVVLDFSGGELLDDLTMLALEVCLPPGS